MSGCRDTEQGQNFSWSVLFFERKKAKMKTTRCNICQLGEITQRQNLVFLLQ